MGSLSCASRSQEKSPNKPREVVGRACTEENAFLEPRGPGDRGGTLRRGFGFHSAFGRFCDTRGLK